MNTYVDADERNDSVTYIDHPNKSGSHGRIL